MKQYFRAPWSELLKVTTFAFAALLMIIMVATDWQTWPIMITVLVGSTLFIVRGYSIQAQDLVIHGLWWRKRYSLADFQGAEANPLATAGAYRVMGSGGVFSSLGFFQNSELGQYLAFLTNKDNSVVVDFRQRRIVISPEDPEGFVKALEEQVLAVRKKINVH